MVYQKVTSKNTQPPKPKSTEKFLDVWKTEWVAKESTPKQIYKKHPTDAKSVGCF